MMNLPLGSNVSVQARVFRKGQKPKIMPGKLWGFMARKRIPGTGRWENLGVVASTKQGNINQ